MIKRLDLISSCAHASFRLYKFKSNSFLTPCLHAPTSTLFIFHFDISANGHPVINHLNLTHLTTSVTLSKQRRLFNSSLDILFFKVTSDGVTVKTLQGGLAGGHPDVKCSLVLGNKCQQTPHFLFKAIRGRRWILGEPCWCHVKNTPGLDSG